jgi:hopanoid biosynthesis associated protein HpnK
LKRLVVTADDFGAAREVNDAVVCAHREGVLTAASLMVSGPAAAQAVACARRAPTLRIGLHLVLVEGRPMLPAGDVSQLVDAQGQFRTDLAMLGATLAFSRRARRQLAAEIDAQFAAFRATGLALDHCNAHKHFHLHPLVGRLTIRIGCRFGLRAVRVPLEPARLLRRAEPQAGWRAGALTTPFAQLLRHQVRAAGLLAPDRVFGLHWSGHMSRERLQGLIRHLPDGLNEIYLHPATGRYPGAAPDYQYREELDALIAPEVTQACRDAAAELGGYSDFGRRNQRTASSIAC